MSEIRDKLLDAGRRQFAAKGFAGTSIRDIVGDAGVNVSLVSYHFGGKLGLYEECIRAYGEGNREFIEKSLVVPVTQEDLGPAMTEFTRAFLARLLEQSDAHRITLREFENNSDLFKRLLGDVFRANFGMFVRYFEACAAQGYLREGVDPPEAALLYHGMLNYLARTDPVRKDWHGESLRDPAVLKRVAEQLTMMILGGIAAHSP